MFTEDGHDHEVHGYNKNSLTTFGQPLRAAADRLRLCCTPFCDGCKTKILGRYHECESCGNVAYCDECINNALTSHAADHGFQEIPPKFVTPRFGPYHASAGAAFKMRPEPNLNGEEGDDYSHLQVQGWLVDTVSRVENGIICTRKLGGGVALTINPSILPHEGAAEPSSSYDAFFRTITGNRVLESVKINDVWEERIGHVPKIWAQIVGNHLPPKLLSQARGDNLGVIHVESPRNSEIWTSISVLAGGSRRYAKTRESIGFVPERTAPGDSIWILDGCTVPVVLRRPECCGKKNDAFWTLIGECYIEGLMEGEYMEVSRERPEPTSIILV